MPIYEYKCAQCNAVITRLRPVSQHKKDVVIECIDEDKPGAADQCILKRILSPTPTTFRFNDRTGFKGLDSNRG